MRKRYIGWLDAILAEDAENYLVKFTVCDGVGVWHHEIQVVSTGDQITFTANDDVDAAMEALGQGPGRSNESARLYWTGRIADELFGRLASCGLFSPMVYERAERLDA